MTIAGVDSAYAPGAASLISAKAAGVKLWAGYFAGPNILHGWSENDFIRVKEGGLATLAYCSGWANPAAMKAQSANWGVPICLDVEGGIRGDGSWVQAWLDASGAGLYGNLGVHTGRRAAFHVLAYYPNPVPTIPMTWVPRATPPSSPCGWQYRGSHSNYGATIDSGWYDDTFLTRFTFGSGSLGDTDLTPEQDGILRRIFNVVMVGYHTNTPADDGYIKKTIKPELDQILAKPAGAVTVDNATVIGAIAKLQAELDVAAGDLATIKRLVMKDLAP